MSRQLTRRRLLASGATLAAGAYFTSAQAAPEAQTITPELVAEHGLKPDEYERILKLIGRAPTLPTAA